MGDNSLALIRCAFYDTLPGFLDFVFRRKLSRMKTQQGTDKASEHIGRTVFSRDYLLLTCASTGVISISSHHLFFIHYNSSTFAPSPLFASTSASSSATNRVRRHRQSTPPPTAEYSIPLVWEGMKKHMTA